MTQPPTPHTKPDPGPAASEDPYPQQAYIFVQEGLGFTVNRVHGDEARGEGIDTHVSGRELCEGLREFAIRRYGLLAPCVLGHWRVRRTDDFGRIVFNMIERRLMSRTDEDSIEDFQDVYDFDEAFSRDRILETLRHGDHPN